MRTVLDVCACAHPIYQYAYARTHTIDNLGHCALSIAIMFLLAIFREFGRGVNFVVILIIEFAIISPNIFLFGRAYASP